jgi:hypothetical protein
MNASKHAALGFSPAQLLFGNTVTLDKGIFLPRNDPRIRTSNPGQTVKEWSDSMLDKQAKILEIARNTQRTSDDAHIVEANPNRTEFPINSYVLVQYRNRPPTKFHSRWGGPMRVVSNNTNEYTLQDLVTNKLKNYHITQLKAFEYDQMKTDPLDIARKEKDEYVVEKVLEHKGSGKTRKTLFFLIKWEGYDDSDNTWEPWEGVKDNQELLKYCYTHNLRKHLTADQKRQVITNDFTSVN